MIKDLLKLADNLDRAGFHKEADDIEKITQSVSSGPGKMIANKAGEVIEKAVNGPGKMVANKAGQAIEKSVDYIAKGPAKQLANTATKASEYLSKSQVQKLTDTATKVSEPLSKSQIKKLTDTSKKVSDVLSKGQTKKLMDTSSKAYEIAKAESAAARAVGTAGRAAGTVGRAAAVGTTEAAAGTAGAIGAGTALATTGAVISAGLLGYEIGTIINEQIIERSGADKALISWLLQPNLKDGIKCAIVIDKASIDPNLLKGASAFVPYGVAGIVMKGNQIVNKNSNATFPKASPVSINQFAEAILPQNPNGLLIPTSVSVSIIYSDGTRRNAVSTPQSTFFNIGTNTITAKITTIARSAR
jgi:hypothetical protein